MAEYLSRRYPTTYLVKRDDDHDSSGWYGLPRIKEITIVPTGTTYKVDEEEPMALAGIMYVLFFLQHTCSLRAHMLTDMRL